MIRVGAWPISVLHKDANMREPAIAALQPPTISERLLTLDVLRGVALLGVFLINVEDFNRAFYSFGAGLPIGASAIDHAVDWLIHTFVFGKFWTMFSMLFGMGFAIMWLRAKAAGREFVAPYLRRTAALAIFGLLHGVFIWSGDILLSYALAAATLLLALLGRVWQGLGLFTVLMVAVLALKIPATGFVALVVFAGLIGLYLRGERSLRLASRDWPMISVIAAVAAILLLLVGSIGMTFMPVLKAAALLLGGAVLAAVAWMAWRYRNPASKRLWRAGAALYLIPLLGLTLFTVVRVVVPDKYHSQPTVAQQQQIKEGKSAWQERIATETRVMSSGTYAEAVELRSRQFLALGGNPAQVIWSLSMFLIGGWFVQSGVIVRPYSHLEVFRKLVRVALPTGIALALASSWVATSHIAGKNDTAWGFAQSLRLMGNLPMSLGYIAIVVLLLQKDVWARLLSWLAPAGQMALTNYLGQSIVGTLFFYGYGLGHWGMARAWQVVFVFVVFALQVLFSRWWLSKFRYGPMEWLWRWFTYARLPSMRLAAA
ncbi:DUF418 domain-containing protein [Lysobacter sp. CFH 32150]|uniref:DUF418 domain-containing protein n=1 Tax=Lysobacter sp. CFH 32150 TaxID=2927128 RepID=UPI001FA7CC9A|nr:DUF418 domain-containing protein [Lysobacter sp. CFH 32150]MCI4566642.1 DUF418 domain-containing protein [Lysobacter sp. CFH 32150]